MVFVTNLKAMKALRTGLSAEGRLDILAKVMSYRGGKWRGITIRKIFILCYNRLFPAGFSILSFDRIVT